MEALYLIQITGDISETLKKQLEKCIMLLEPIYYELPYTVMIWEDQKECERKLKRNNLFRGNIRERIFPKKGYQHAIPALLMPKQKQIHLFRFNMQKHFIVKYVDLVGMLYHEIHRAWQYEYEITEPEEEEFYFYHNPNKSEMIIPEQEAYKFHETMINQHSKKIIKIMKLPLPSLRYEIFPDIRELVYPK